MPIKRTFESDFNSVCAFCSVPMMSAPNIRLFLDFCCSSAGGTTGRSPAFAGRAPMMLLRREVDYEEVSRYDCIIQWLCAPWARDLVRLMLRLLDVWRLVRRRWRGNSVRNEMRGYGIR